MTYLEALEPGTDLKKDSPYASDLPFSIKAEVYFGAYANVLNSFKNSLSEEATFENKAEITQSDNEYDSILSANEVETTLNGNETYENSDSSSQENIESTVVKTDSVEIRNDIFEENSAKTKKLKNKKNKKIGKFVINPEESEKSGFIDWLFNFKPIEGSNTAKIVYKKKKKRSKVQEEIERSVQRGEDIVSEHLALLYEKQKHYEMALEMFQKLNLKYPEKSSYFALKISELNSKIKND